MNPSNIPKSGQRKSIPHYGWVAGRLGLWNLLGLIPLVAGITDSL